MRPTGSTGAAGGVRGHASTYSEKLDIKADFNREYSHHLDTAVSRIDP